MALQNAENEIEHEYGYDTMSSSSEQTILISEDKKNLFNEIDRLHTSLKILKQRYDDVCLKNQVSPNYDDIVFNTTPSFEKIKKVHNELSFMNEPSLFGKNYGNEMEGLSENIEKGLQRLSMKLMNNQLKLIPLNQLTQPDIEHSDKFILFFEKAKSLLLQLALLVYNLYFF